MGHVFSAWDPELQVSPWSQALPTCHPSGFQEASQLPWRMEIPAILHPRNPESRRCWEPQDHVLSQPQERSPGSGSHSQPQPVSGCGAGHRPPPFSTWATWQRGPRQPAPPLVARATPWPTPQCPPHVATAASPCPADCLAPRPPGGQGPDLSSSQATGWTLVLPARHSSLGQRTLQPRVGPTHTHGPTRGSLLLVACTLRQAQVVPIGLTRDPVTQHRRVLPQWRFSVGLFD